MCPKNANSNTSSAKGLEKRLVLVQNAPIENKTDS